MNIKVRRLGQPSKRVTLEEGSTISDALDAVGVEVRGGETIYVNGDEAANVDVELNDGESVILQADVKLGC